LETKLKQNKILKILKEDFSSQLRLRKKIKLFKKKLMS